MERAGGAITIDTIPRLAAKVRLKHDKVRDKELLLLPERVVILNETAASILRLCDGERSVATIAGDLRERLLQGAAAGDGGREADGQKTTDTEKEPAAHDTDGPAGDLPDLAAMQADIVEFITEMAGQSWVEVD